MKRIFKSKKVKVNGFFYINSFMSMKEFECIITNDTNGKTLSINDGIMQFTIPFEPIARYLK